MKRIILTLGVMAFGFFAKAQSQEKVDSTYLKNWMHSNFEDTGVYGVNTQKALDFLKEHYRKPQNIVVGVLDSGVEYFHEDLKNNIWVNPKEKVEMQKSILINDICQKIKNNELSNSNPLSMPFGLYRKAIQITKDEERQILEAEKQYEKEHRKKVEEERSDKLVIVE